MEEDRGTIIGAVASCAGGVARVSARGGTGGSGRGVVDFAGVALGVLGGMSNAVRCFWRGLKMSLSLYILEVLSPIRQGNLVGLEDDSLLRVTS
jgi:hypothetical protein